MLERSTVPRRRRNEQGSILLGVIVMTMFMLSFATIALSVVQYTTDRTSRNVQKKQAKMTAETALTEFINGFASGEIDYLTSENRGDNKLSESEAKLHKYDSLAAIADGHVGENNAAVFQVGIEGESDEDFNSDYGETLIKVYKQSPGFIVKSETTFSRMTQTASIFFQSEAVIPAAPSNCLETTAGASQFGWGWKEGINGSIRLEKSTGDTLKTLHVGNSDKKEVHFYTEYNISANAHLNLQDLMNRTTTNNYNHTNSPFKQAPTLVSEGYISAANGGISVVTGIGKTDTTGHNGTDLFGRYHPDELGNYDGYIKCKKLIAGKAENVTIGQASTNDSKDIDVYCYGTYVGGVPDSFTSGGQTHVFADAGDIKNDRDLGYQFNGSTQTWYGNFYSFNNGNNYENGDFVIANDGGGTNLTIDGDVCIEGNLYIASGCKLTVTGDFYILGKVYSASGEVTTINGGGATNGGVLTVNGTAYPNRTCKGDTQRSTLPGSGYMPLTGEGGDSKTKLADYYKDASANDMFMESLNGNAAAGDLAAKYATAMSRYIDSSYTIGSNVYKVADVSTVTTAEGANRYHITIKSSTRLEFMDSTLNNGLKSDHLEPGGYKFDIVVKLTNSDIIIAMPMNWDSYPAIRLDTDNLEIDPVTGKPKQFFCYFMYYDSSDPEKCYYLNEDQGNKTVNTYNSTSQTELATSMELKAAGKSDSVTEDYYNGKKEDGSSVTTGKDILTDSNSSLNITMKTYNRQTVGICDTKLYKDDSKFVAGEPFSTMDPDRNVTADQYAADPNLNIENRIMYLVPNGISMTIGGNQMETYQGVVYALHSNITHRTDNSSSYQLGQIKARTYYTTGDSGANCNLMDCPMADGSLLNFAASKNSVTDTVKIQYYNY